MEATPWKAYTRATQGEVKGTWDTTCFQVALPSVRASEAPASSALQLPCFDALGYVCAPSVGTYGEDYDPCVSKLLVQGTAVDFRVPQALCDAVADHGVPLGSVFVQVHARPQPQPCQHFTCPRTDEVNVMWHPWALQGHSFASVVESSVRCGVWCARGTLETHQNDKDVLGSGMPFDRLEERGCCIHSMAFSPLNCQVRLDDDAALHSFWCAAVNAKGEGVASLHVIPGTVALDQMVQSVCSQAHTLGDLVEALDLMAITCEDTTEAGALSECANVLRNTFA